MAKTKIILDADVIIHFAKGDMLSLLPKIFGDYDFVVLDTVYNEIKEPLKSQIDNQVKQKDSKLPDIDFTKFVSSVHI